jgi:hypothetical protein
MTRRKVVAMKRRKRKQKERMGIAQSQKMKGGILA